MTGQAALGGGLLLVVFASLTPAAAAGSGPHNYLERFAAHRTTWANICELDKKHLCDVSLEYNTTVVTHSGQWIEVLLAGVRKPAETDLLAIYAPPDAYLDGTAPIKYTQLGLNAKYLASGAARVPLRLINLRVDMRAVFVRGGLDAPLLEVAGPVVETGNPNECTGIHLFLNQWPTSMTVQWTTRDVGSPQVKYGEQSGQLRWMVPAETNTYSRSAMCGGQASNEGFIDPGMLHTAVMTGLRPGKRYFYMVGDPDLGTWSPEHSFVSNPGPGNHDTVRILAAADQGVGEPDGFTAAMEYQPAMEVQRLMDSDARDNDYGLYFMNGDLSYARGYGALWDTWLYQGRHIFQSMPMMTTPGNHEIDWLDYGFYSGSKDSGGECGVPYARRFPMPGAWLQQPWYSFEFGPIHITVASTEHDFTVGSAQNKFIEADLASVSRERTPWLVFVSHRPVYVNANDFAWPDGKQTTAIQLRTALEHMLIQYKVDVALSGHHHSYQRTCPVRGEKCHSKSVKHHHPGAPVYVVHGHAGADFYNNGFDPIPEWVEFNAQTTFGYLRLEVNGSSFHLQSVNSSDGQVMDEFTLHRPGSHASVPLVGME